VPRLLLVLRISGIGIIDILGISPDVLRRQDSVREDRSGR